MNKIRKKNKEKKDNNKSVFNSGIKVSAKYKIRQNKINS